MKPLRLQKTDIGDSVYLHIHGFGDLIVFSPMELGVIKQVKKE